LWVNSQKRSRETQISGANSLKLLWAIVAINIFGDFDQFGGKNAEKLSANPHMEVLAFFRE
jgi:hypothetical protein